MSTQLLPFLELPDDITRLLVEAIGETGHNAALAVALSCRRHQQWIYPIIYRSVNLRSVHSIETFLYALQSNSRLHSLVKFLTIDSLPGTCFARACDSAIQIISHCIEAISIALWSLKDSHQVVDLRKHNHLRKISIHMEYFMADTPHTPGDLPESIPSFMFNLTHLDLYEFRERVFQRAKILPYLHKLTHLFMVSDSDQALQVVSHFTPYLPPSLKVWIIHLRHYDSNDKPVLNELAGGKVDSRLVISMKTTWGVRDVPNAAYIVNRALAQSSPKNTIWREWGHPLDRGPDFWEEAEEVVEQRRRSKRQSAWPPNDASDPEPWTELHW